MNDKYMNIKYIIIIGIILRIITAIFLYDFNNSYYWEFGEIAKNLIHGNGYSFFYYEGNSLMHTFTAEAKPLPSAYMPPMYVFYMVPFMLIENDILRNILLILANIGFSAITIVILFNFTKNYFSNNIAIISALIYAVLPEFLYTTISFGPTLFYHILVLLFLICLTKVNTDMKSRFYYALPAISFGLLAIRAEFAVMIAVGCLYLIKSKHYKLVAAICFAAFILIAPWSIRNYMVFDKFIPTTTNSGLNFYRGHNPEGPGTWGNGKVDEKIIKYKDRKDFEVYMNNEYFNESFDFIKNNAATTVKNSFIKLFHLWLFNPNDTRSRSIAYLLPWLLLLSLSIVGVVKTFSWDKYKYIYYFLIFHSITAVIFFAIPRYQTMMKIVLVPFAAYSIYLLYDWIKQKHFASK